MSLDLRMDGDGPGLWLDPEDAAVKCGVVISAQRDTVPHFVFGAWGSHRIDVRCLCQIEVEPAHRAEPVVGFNYVSSESPTAH